MKVYVFVTLMGLLESCLGGVPVHEEEQSISHGASTAHRFKRQSLPGDTCPKPVSHDATYPTDCADILRSCSDHSDQAPRSGQYMIQPDGGQVVKVFCDMETDGGGWTVFQRRIGSPISFYRPWNEYKQGFGNLNTDFWLGNDHLHYLTSQRDYELRVDLTNTLGHEYYAKYDKFEIGDSFSEYLLVVGGYSGTAGDSLAIHNLNRFSTYDNDNDKSSSNCASSYYGAWWYKSCHYSNLNGGYYDKTGYASVHWYHLPGDNDQIPFAEMKIRPREM